MTGLRAHVADAIQRDQESGGAGVLTDEEIAAVEWAMVAAARAALDRVDGAERHRDTLAVMLHELGPRRMSIHGAKDRRDPYWLRCADIAINAYDDWLDRARARGAVGDIP